MTPGQPSALLLAHVAATMRRRGKTLRDGRDHVHEPDRPQAAPTYYARCRVCDLVLRSPF